MVFGIILEINPGFPFYDCEVPRRPQWRPEVVLGTKMLNDPCPAVLR
jgi:hypothetical protein